MVDDRNPEYPYHYTWRDTDDGAPMRLKPAAMPAMASWPELAAYREHPDYLNRMKTVYCLWRKIEKDDPMYCRGNCDRCEEKRAALG